MRPLRNNLIVLMDESRPNTVGLIVPTDISRFKLANIQIGNRGTVVIAGPGKCHSDNGVLMPNQCKAGDVVRFSELEYPSFLNEGIRYVVINEGDIIGVEDHA